MKKFMIFLLMAFLYLGTCQARSEASHPDNAKLKLLSWVTPTPSQSFLTRSAAVQDSVPDEMIIHVEGPEVGCAQAAVTFTAVIQTPVNPLADYTYVWKMDGEALQAGTNGVLISNDYTGQTLTFIPENLFPELPDNPVTHEFTVEVSYGECSVSVSPVHPFTINPQTELELVIPAYACDGQLTSTLTAMLTSGVAPEQYKWFIVPKTDATFDTTITYVTYTNELNISNALMANADSIGVMPLFTNPNCPVDTFWNTNVPTYDQMHTLVITGNNTICQNTPATMTATPVEHAYYKWAGPDTAAINAHDSSNNYLTTTVPGVYAVTMYDTLNGCEATAQFTITQFGGSLSITADQTAVCANTPVMLHASVTGFDNQMVAFAWSTNDTASTITVSPADTTTYTVTAYAVGYDAVEGLEAACTMTDSIKIYAAAPVNYQTVIYNSVQNPTIYSNNPVNSVRLTPAHYCEGQEIALYYVSDSRSTGDASTLYNWYVDGYEIASNTRDLMIPAGMEVGSHYITAMAVVSGCNTATMSNSLNFIVHAAPEVTISGNNVICNGDTAFITANGTTMLYHPTSDVVYTHKYIWSDSAQTAVDTITTGGTYTVTVTNVVSGKEICSTTATVEVNTFGGDLHVTADQTVICAGTPVVLNANLDGFNNENVVYAWNTTAQDTASMITVFPTDTTTYVVTAIAGNCTKQDSITIYAAAIQTVNTEVTLESSIATKDTICLGQQAVYFHATNDGEATTYTWYMDGQEIAGENLADLELNFYDLGTHYITAKANVVGCAVATVSSPEVEVYVSAAPQVSIAGNNVICNGDTAILVAQVINPLSSPYYTQDLYTYTYAWNDNTTTTDTLKAVTPGIYAVTVTNNFGCFSTANIEVTTFGGDLHVNASRTVTCAGDAVVLSADLDGFNNELVSYAWSTNDTASIITVFPTDTTTYVVTAIAGNCSMTDSVNITVRPLPVINSVTPSAEYICQGGQVTFVVDPAAANNTYEWYLNGVQLTGEGTSTLTLNLNEAGAYQVSARIINEYGCSASNTNVAGVVEDEWVQTGFFPWSGHYESVFNPIIVKVVPTPQVTLSGNSIICDGSEAVIKTGVMPNSDVFETGISTGSSVIDFIIGGIEALVNYFDPADFDYEYAWSNGTTADSLKTGIAGIYTVTVTNTAHDLNCAATASVEIITSGSDLQVYADKMNVCEGEFVVLNADLDGYVNDNIIYTWTNEDGDTIGNVSTITVQTEANEDNQALYTVTIGAGACERSATITINVTHIDTVYTTLEEVNTICVNNQITAIATTEPEAAATEFIWYLNGLEMPGENQPTITLNMLDEGSYSLAAKAVVEGCTYAPVSEPVYFNVNNNPTVMITGDPIICEGNTVNLYAQLNDTVPGMEGYNYDWRLYNYSLNSDQVTTPHFEEWWQWLYLIMTGHPYTTTDTTPDMPQFLEDYVFSTSFDNADHITVSDLPAQDYPYVFTLVVTNNEGCVVASEPYYVYVNSDPHVVATVSDTIICANGEITAQAHLGDGHQPGINFQWQYSYDGEEWENIPYGLEPTLVTDMFDQDVYLRVVATQNGQGNNSGCTATSDSILIHVITPKQVSSVVVINDGNPATNICEGAQLEITAKMLDDEGHEYIDSSYTYMWELNGMQLQTIHGPQFSAQAYIYDNDPVDYVYTAYVVLDVPGCMPIPVSSDTVHVRRNPIVTIDGNPNVCYFGPGVENIVLTAWVDGAVDLDATYRWFESGQYRPNPSGFDNNYRESWVPTYQNPYIFTVEVTNGDGCSTISEPFEVNVYEKPVVNITGDAYMICEDGSVTLQANLNNYNDPMLTFQWYMDEVNNTHIIDGATHEIQVFQPVDTTDYIVMVTHLMDYNTQYCVAYDTFKVFVAPKPVVTATFEADLVDVDTICEGRTITMTATTTGGVEGSEAIYTWYRNGELIENVNGPLFVDAPTSVNNQPAKYIYSVKVNQTASGCESDLVVFDSIIVNPTPTVMLYTDPIVCENGADNVKLYANVYPESNDYIYRWFENNVLIADTTSDSLYLTKPFSTDPYNFSVQIMNDYGCVAQGDAMVYVNAQPVVNIFVTDTTVCVGGEITLSAALNDWNADMLTFQWFDGNDTIHGATTLSYTYAPEQGNHTYSLVVNQLTSGCTATSQNTLNVTVTPDPIITSVTPSMTNICYGGQIQITAAINVNSTDAVFTWYRNGILMEGATAGTIYDTPGTVDNNTQTYTYTAVVTLPHSGCTSAAVTSSAVTVYPNPTPVITGDQHVCETDSVFLIANVDTTGMAAGALHYTWYESGQIRDNMAYGLGDNNFYAEYFYARTEPYRFTVEVSRNNAATGCVATSAEYVVYVYPQPVVNITASETEICEGGEVTLTANLNDYNADNITYQWYTLDYEQTILAVGFNANGGYILDTVYTPVHNYIPGATQPTYTTTLNDTTILGVTVLQTNSTCVATDEITINVRPIPVVNYVTVNGSSVDTICDGGEVMVYANVTLQGHSINDATYNWYRNGVLIEGADGPFFFETLNTDPNQTSTYLYKTIVTLPGSGCVSNTVTTPHALVFVNPAPSTVTINGNNVICEGSTTTLHAYSDVEGTFTWSNGVEGVDSIVVPAGVYTVTMLTAEGCEMTSEPFSVEAFGTDLLVSASATSICQGEHTTLYVNQDGWQGNVTYLWCEDANNSTATTVDVQPLATTTYHVTATVSSTNGSCSQVGEVTIIVNPMPVIDSVTVSNTLICEGNQVTFTAFADENATSYIWYNNGFEIPGENQAVITYTFNQVGVYNFSVKAISNENCVAAVAVNAPAVTVTPAPTQVSITGENVICFGTTAELVAHSDVEGTFAWSNGMTGDTINVTAGIYNVTVTTSEGCSLTSPDYVVESFGTDLIVSATETSICEGDHTTLSVDQEGWNGNVTYEWSTGSTATTIDVTPVATTTYYVTATVNNEAGSCSTVGEITITVNPRPATLVLVAVPDSVCVGEQYQVAAIDTTFAGNISGYIWYENGVEMEGENQMYLTLSQDQAGVYRYAAKAISNEGCVSAHASAQVYVHVIAAPESVVISGNTTICNGGSTVLTANVTPNEPATYVWYKDEVPMNINASQITVTVPGSYKVEASFHGCTTVSAPVVVTVQEAPQMQLTATETEICVGGSTVITAEVTGWNNDDVNYNWNNGFQGSAYTFNATTAGVETFIVTASQSTSGCVATDTITITVNAIPAKPVVNIANQTVCYGGQVTLQVTNAIAGAEYTWYRNGTLIPGAHQATLTESPVSVDGDATVYTYTVVASLPNSGCTSEPSDNAVVNVIPTPVVAVSVEGNTMFCQGGTTMLHANVTPAANYSYQWYKDNQLIEGATSADYVVANEDARETAYNFTVVVTANAGCDVTSQAVAITVVADPVVTATISDAIVCEGGVTTLTATVQGGVPGVNGLNEFTYQWYRNTPNSTDPSAAAQLVATGATYTTDGTETPNNYTYWVVVNNGYNCNALSTPVQFSVVEVPTVNIVRVPEYDATVCDGGETAIKAVIVSGGYGDATYQWYKNGNILAGETNQVLHIATLAYGVNDTYSVEVIQTGVGCFGNASAPINDLVTVNPAYTVDITGFGNVCEGGTLTLTATVNNVIAGDVLNYQWYKIMNGEEFPINGANSATYATSDLLLGNSYEYFVVVSSSFSGCYTVSSTVPANVVSAPSVAIQGANTVCEGGNLTLNAFVTGGVDGMDYIYTWNWTGAANGTATTADPNFVPTLAANDVATPYYFTVTISRPDNTGCTATSAAHEVNVLAVPTVSVTADNAYVCQNGDVTLTAHVSPVGSYNYVWTINGQQQAVNAATVTASMATTGAINATVVVSAAGASASCSATASLAVPVQVVAAPTVTIAADYTSLCVGGTTTLTANVNANGNIPGDFSYQWAINGIEVDGAVANTFVQPLNAAGVYTYTLRVSQNNNLGCNSAWSAPVTVQVAEQPVVTLSSLDGLNICEGGSVTLNAVVTNYGTTVNGVLNSNVYGAMTFDWTRNGVNVHQDANVNTGIKQFTETLNTIGSYNYQVTVDAAGQNCLPQVSNVENVGVAGNPSWTEVHVYSNNGTDACLGEMVTLMASIQGGVFDPGASTNGHIQWVVTDENGNTINVSGGLGGNSYDIPAAAGTYIYTPTYVDNIGSGCQLTNTADVQVGVTVHELPTAQFTSGDGTSICANDGSASAELVITFTGVAPFVYEVVDGNGNVVEHASTLANTVSIYVSPSEQTTYRINLVQDAYCENTALDANAIATVYVNEIQFATNFFVSGCNDNGQVTISFDVISGNPSAAFTVVYENGLQASGNISNGTATFVAPTTPGDYNAVFTVDGCSYDIVVRVLVGDYGFGGTLPIMDQRWNDVVVVNNNPQTNGGHTFVGYQWYHNGVAIPGATYSNYQDKDGLNGFYSVELIEQDADGNMITYQTCEMYFNTTGSVKVYPVPANVRQEITIELDLTSEQLEGAVLDIFSVTGAHISHVTDLQPITKIEGFKAQGTYFGRILTGTNEIKTVKFVIVK